MPRRGRYVLNRRDFLKASSSAAALTVLPGLIAERAARARSTANPPNILVVISDQLRADTIGALGSLEAYTPNLDRLVREGVAFTNFFQPAAQCSPSRATMFTGREIHAHQVWANVDRYDGSGHNALPADEVTFPQYIHQEETGYEEFGYFGKYHLVDEEAEPLPRGFDYYSSKKDYDQFLKDQGFDGEQCGEIAGAVGYTDLPRAWLPDSFWTTQCIDWLAGVGSKRFVAVLSMVEPHPPWCYNPNEELWHQPEDFENYFERKIESYKDKHQGKPSIQYELLGIKNLQDHPNVNGLTKPSEVRRLLATYYQLVSQVDDNVGRLLRALDDLSLSQNTLVIFVADHGEQLVENQLLFKGPLVYDSSTHVPCLMRLPGVIPAGLRISEMTSSKDLAPTILDYACVNPILAKPLHGHSLRWLVEGGPRPFRALVPGHYGEYYEKTTGDGNGSGPVAFPIKNFRDEKFSFAWNLLGVNELYDIRLDPSEIRNLANDGYQNRIRECKERILEWMYLTGAAEEELATWRAAF